MEILNRVDSSRNGRRKKSCLRCGHHTTIKKSNKYSSAYYYNKRDCITVYGIIEDKIQYYDTRRLEVK